MGRLAVFGFPVTHSLSPSIHKAFAEQLDLVLTYEKIETQAGKLKNALENFRRQGGSGANVTLPLKQEAFKLCDQHTPAASYAKAVNTLFWKDTELWGDNTDGEGLIRDLTLNLQLNLKDKRILILGAGGAVCGILPPLLAHAPAAIVIVNRTLEKAQALATSTSLKAYNYEDFNASLEAPFDLVLNATSASLFNTLVPLEGKWVANAIALDLAYRQGQETVFMQWASVHNAKATYDGLGMLVEQAALAFACWYKQLPHTQPVMRMLRSKLF